MTRRKKILLFLLTLCLSIALFACNSRKDTEGNDIVYSEIKTVEVDKDSIASGFMLKDFDISSIILIVTYDPESETGKKMQAEQQAAGVSEVSYSVSMPASYDMIKAEDKAKLTTSGSKTITIIYGKFEISFVITLYDNTATELYKVTFYDEDGETPLSETQYVKAGGRASVPALNLKPGFDFIGWKDAETDSIETYDNIRKDTSFIAYFLPSTKEVRFNIRYRSVNSQGKIEYTSPANSVFATITLGRTEKVDGYYPDPIDISGYTFAGWQTEIVSGETAYYAVYDRDSYDITFVYRPYDASSGRYSDSLITGTVGYYPDQNVISEPTDAYCEGISPANDYQFIGWSVNHDGKNTPVTFPYTMSTVCEICFYANYVDINAGSFGLVYKSSGNGVCMISDYTGDNNVVVIPEKATVGGSLCDVTGIEDGAFKGSAVTAYVVSSENRYFSVVDDTLYNKVGDILYAYPIASAMTELSVPAGVKVISSYAFFTATNLTQVNLPDSLLRIDDFAFAECSGLVSVSVPGNVTAIEEGAFHMSNGSAISMLNFSGNKLTEVGDEAFYGLNSLEELVLPVSLRSIGDGAFYGLSALKSISTGGNTNFVIYNDALYSADYRNLVLFPALDKNIVNPEVVLHENCRKVKRGAFYHAVISCITFRTACELEAYCIVCPALEAIRFTISDFPLEKEEFEQSFGGFVPSRIYVLKGDSTFDVYGDAVIHYQSLSWKGYENYTEEGYIFSSSDKGLTILGYHGTGGRLNIPDLYNGKPIIAIAPYAFYENKDITSVTFPQFMTSIGEYAFYGCSSLTSFTNYSSELKKIGSFAFYDCSALVSCASTTSDNVNVTEFGKFVFEGTRYIVEHDINDFVGWGNILLRYVGQDSAVTVPSQYSYIASDAFKDMGFITSITFRTGSLLTFVDEYAFQNCIGLREVTFPASLKHVADYAFYGCEYLFNVTYNCNQGEVEIGYFTYKEAGGYYTDYSAVYETFNDTPTYELTLQVNISTIYHNVDFHPVGNAYVSARSLPTTNNIFLGWFYDMAFSDPAVFPMYIEKDTVLYARFESSSYISDGLSYENNDDGNYSVSAYTGKDGYVIIPETYKTRPVTGIGSNVFGKNVISVRLPSQIEFIEENAFTDSLWYTSCSGDFVIYDDNILVGYKGNAKEVHIPAGINMVANGVFKNNVSIEKVYLPEGLTTIVDEMFYGCTNLTSITLGSFISSIGEKAFYGCSNLATVNIESGSRLTSISAAAFDGTKWFADQTDDCIIINNIFYRYCGDSSSLHIPEGVVSIAAGAFENNIVLRSVYLPTTLSSISYDAFKNCALSEVHIPASGSQLQFIMDSAFEGCYNLALFKFSNATSLMEINKRAFFGCSSLGDVLFPSSLNTLGEYAFSQSGVKNVSFGETSSLRAIREGAFARCYYLSSVTFGSGILSEIGTRAFYECVTLESYVNAYSSTTTIGSEAFYNCLSLKNLSVNAYVIKNIGANAFYNVGNYNFTTDTENYMIILGNILLSYRGSQQVVTIPKDIILIYNSAFEGNTHLIEVRFENGSKINNINDRAFYGCSNLSLVDFPSTVSFVGDDVMTGTAWYNDRLRYDDYVIIGKTLIKYNVQTIEDVKSELLGGRVDTINKGAFEGKSVYNISIGDGLTLIKKGAFDGIVPAVWTEDNKTCTGYTITIETETPPTLEYEESLRYCYRIYFENESVLDTYRLNAEWNIQFYRSETDTSNGVGTDRNRVEIIKRYALTYSILTSEGYPIDPEETHALYSPRVVTPVSTAKKQHEFVGWFMDRDYFEAVKYPLVLTGPTTIYAKLVDYSVGSNPESFGLKLNDDDTYTISEYNDRSDKKLVIITEQSGRDITSISGHLGYLKCSKEFYYTIGYSVDTDVFVYDEEESVTYYRKAVSSFKKGVEYFEAKDMIVTENMIGTTVPQDVYIMDRYDNLILATGQMFLRNTAYYKPEYYRNYEVGDSIDPEAKIYVLSRQYFMEESGVYQETGKYYKAKSVTVDASLINTEIPDGIYVLDDNDNLIKTGGKYKYRGTGNYFQLTLMENVDVYVYVENPDGSGEFAIYDRSIHKDGDDNYQFYCRNTIIEEITFANNCTITELGAFCFAGMTSLKKVTLPASLKRIDANAFAGCTALEEIVFSTGISDVVIESYAFYGCTALVTLTVPEGIRELQDSAFVGCSSLINIYATAMRPYELPKDAVPFEFNPDLKIYVYSDARVMYESAWSVYKEYIEEISNTTGE